MEIMIPYYEDMTRISNSNIGWFLKKGPAYLHFMLTGKAEGETGRQLARGTMTVSYTHLVRNPKDRMEDI